MSVVLVFLLLPVLILGLPLMTTLIFVRLRSRVPRRGVIVGSVGTLVGIAVAVLAITWAMYPLTGFAIAGVPMDAEGGGSIARILVRLAIAVVSVIVVTLVILLALSRLVRPSPNPTD